ncbi:formate-dependent phosphoribosylglycinamide formyltransferase [bacterium]|nr:MAG: formate-dependent phosphoribosylglycinamide formyltransferase [bacterium]
MKTILLLGSGELGKELAIALGRLGQKIIAVDRYDGAPAMAVTPFREVVDMLDGAELDRLVEKHKPDLVVPEIEAIRTERFYEYEQQGIGVVPSARAANFTMNRRAIRDLAAQELGLRTAPYRYASNFAELKESAEALGYPLVVKPLMSSSGKGQSTVRSADDLERAWDYAATGGRTGAGDIIVEGFVRFHSEITLLTVTQKTGQTLFCPPIGHVQERGDYMESWQPCAISSDDLAEAQRMAAKVTESLGGAGIWGVEFFLTEDGVVFSELSPRPHDTGMVTLSGTQNLSEFELHARAILGLPIPSVDLLRAGASAVVLASGEGVPRFEGIEDALSEGGIDVRLFGKPVARPYRRMAVALASAPVDEGPEECRTRAKTAAAKIRVVAE